MYRQIIESAYGGSPDNFHVARKDDELHVELTYPPYTDADNANGQCRHVYVNQESVRASDGIRVHYDFERDGFVIEQPEPYEVEREDGVFEGREKWIEVAFCQSWKFDKRETD